jgi:hypothetical protein
MFYIQALHWLTWQTLPTYAFGAFLGFVVLRMAILARKRSVARRMRHHMATTGLDALQKHLEAEIRAGRRRKVTAPVASTLHDARAEYAGAFLRASRR